MVWCYKEYSRDYAEDPSQSKLEQIMKFGKTRRVLKGWSLVKSNGDLIDLWLSSWLTSEERQDSSFDATKLKLSGIPINKEGIQAITADK